MDYGGMLRMSSIAIDSYTFERCFLPDFHPLVAK